MVTAPFLLVFETSASLWGSFSCCGVLRSRRGLVLGQPNEKANLIKYGEVLWPFREHVWGEGAVPVQGLAVQATFSRVAPAGASEVKCFCI